MAKKPDIRGVSQCKFINSQKSVQTGQSQIGLGNDRICCLELLKFVFGLSPSRGPSWLSPMILSDTGLELVGDVVEMVSYVSCSLSVVGAAKVKSSSSARDMQKELSRYASTGVNNAAGASQPRNRYIIYHIVNHKL